MLGIRLLLLIFASACGLCAAAQLASADTEGANTDVIVTRDDVFYIPFTADADLSDASLSLFVSGDAGNSWQFYQRQNSSVGRFSFRAGVDGEFWFAVRASQEMDGTAEHDFDAPELRVSIDRQQPQLTLLANLAADGSVSCQWNAEDAHLDLTSLQLEYQAVGESAWLPAMIDSQSITTHETGGSGHAKLPIATRTGVIQIRALVKDRAGNTATVNQDYDIASLRTDDLAAKPLPNGPASPTQGSLENPITNPFANALPPQASAMQPSPGTDSVAAELPRTIAPHDSSFMPNMSSTASAADQPQATGPLAPLPMQETPRAPNLAQSAPPADDIRGWQGSGMARTPAIESGQQSALSDLPLPGGVEAVTNPMIASYPSTAMPDMLSDTSHRVSNSRRFELEYGVDAVRPDQIHRVEVWYTVDGGRSWRHHGDDEDRVSPYLMTVDEDGLVGVRLLVQTQSGFTIRPPESGDPADVWVRVDATRPVGRITSVKYGVDKRAGALELYWEARDENLADRPIQFLYSNQPQGPWRKVADALPNTGSYIWELDDRAPAQIYLRLEISDLAGNLFEETLPTPINNQRIAPRGRIRAVRPASLPSAPFAR